VLAVSNPHHPLLASWPAIFPHHFTAALEAGNDPADFPASGNASRLAHLVIARLDSVFIKVSLGEVFDLRGTIAEVRPPALERFRALIRTSNFGTALAISPAFRSPGKPSAHKQLHPGRW
jgi:hypothetical protein